MACVLCDYSKRTNEIFSMTGMRALECKDFHYCVPLCVIMNICCVLLPLLFYRKSAVQRLTMDQNKRSRRPRGKRGQGDVTAAAAAGDDVPVNVAAEGRIELPPPDASPAAAQRGANGRAKTQQQNDVQLAPAAALPTVAVAFHPPPGVATPKSRETSPMMDDKASSVVSTASSSTTLQLLKERSKDEGERRVKAFLRFEGEREASRRLDVAREEQNNWAELMNSSKAAISVMMVIAAQQKSTSTLMLQRRHAQQREEVEDEESEQRNEVLDLEVEMLMTFVAHRAALVAGGGAYVSGPPSVGSVTPLADNERSEQGGNDLHHEDDVVARTPATTNLSDEANVAFHELRTNAPSASVTSDGDTTAAKKARKSDAALPPPRTAESICPCSIM